MIRVLLATRNEGKAREMRELLRSAVAQLESLAAHPEVGEIEETGQTFDANARLKAAHAARESGMWTIAEDSGLQVDALGGDPGVRSARFAGFHGDDAANNRKLFEAMKGKTDRAARYVCAIALASPTGEIVTTSQGTCEGRIAMNPRGDGGFGYDPYFEPEGETRTNAELSPRQKDAISHRGRALRAFVPLLRAHLDREAAP